MKSTTVFLYLDACRPDYITKLDSPFLYNLKEKGVSVNSVPVFGFCHRTAMFTGLYPDKSHHFTKYRYDPENSPFKWVSHAKNIREISRLRSTFSKAGIRIITKIITRTLYPDPAFIPFELLPYFDVVDNKIPLNQELANVPNLLSICDAHRYTYLNLMYKLSFLYSKKYTQIFGKLKKSLNKGEKYNLYMFHLSELDMLGHKYGPKEVEVRDFLRKIDLSLKELSIILQEHYDNFKFVIASDHGMSRVMDSVDIEGRLERLRFKPCKDYIYFLDSTMARFWFNNENAKKGIIRMLSDIPQGHIASEEEKNHLHINFKNNEYGDVIFLLHRGYIIHPSFFSIDHVPRGMHGWDNDEDGLGIIMVYSTGDDLKTTGKTVASEIDVFPTLLNVLGLPSPNRCAGKSIVSCS